MPCESAGTPSSASHCPTFRLFIIYHYTSAVDPVQTKGESEEVGETVDSGEYNVYSTFQSHEPDFDYLKSLEIEEKINKIRWLPQQNAAHFLLSTNGKTLPTYHTVYTHTTFHMLLWMTQFNSTSFRCVCLVLPLLSSVRDKTTNHSIPFQS